MIDPIEKHKATEALLEVLDSTLLLEELGPKLTCIECNAIVHFLTVHERFEPANELLRAHSQSDEEGDDPAHLKIKYDNED